MSASDHLHPDEFGRKNRPVRVAGHLLSPALNNVGELGRDSENRPVKVAGNWLSPALNNVGELGRDRVKKRKR